jgi:hypothetical protein
LPVVQEAFAIVPLLPFPDVSCSVDPDPSSNEYAATGLGGDWVDCVLEHADVVAEIDGLDETFPAASKAATASVYEVPQVSPEIAYEVEVVCPSDEPFR